MSSTCYRCAGFIEKSPYSVRKCLIKSIGSAFMENEIIKMHLNASERDKYINSTANKNE